MVQYKLTYFDVRGLAEPSRCILHYAGVEFDDVRLTHEQWPSVKASTPFGQLPVLEFDGIKLPQSTAIARYLARKYGLNGKDEVEAAQIDSYVELLKDLYQKIFPYLLVLSGRSEGDKEKLHKEFVDTLDQICPLLEKGVNASGSGFLAKSGVSYADFLLANCFLTLKKNTGADVEKFSILDAHLKRVHELPKLKKYISGRKDTAF